MKKVIIFVVFNILAITLFASCPFFQISNDCNSNSTSIILKNESIDLDIHGNWKQGNISYKFQSGSEILFMNFSSTSENRIDLEVKYKNKAVSMYYDISSSQMIADDYDSFQNFWLAIPEDFREDISIILNEFPRSTDNLNYIYIMAYSLLNHISPHSLIEIGPGSLIPINFVGDIWDEINFILCCLKGVDPQCCHCLFIVKHTLNECRSSGDCSYGGAW